MGNGTLVKSFTKSLVKSLNKSFTLEAGKSDYKIVDGKLVWANPNLYLEGSGTQWIDTGIKSASNLVADMEYYREAGQLFGFTGTLDGVNKTFGYGSAGSGAYARIGTWYLTNNSAWENEAWLNFHFERGINNSTINGVKFTTQAGSQNTFSNGGEIGLFVYKGSGTETPMTGKIKYLKISQGGTLLLHLVPVPAGLVIGETTISANGMFDIVSQTFFANQGTGDFGYGKI